MILFNFFGFYLFLLWTLYVVSVTIIGHYIWCVNSFYIRILKAVRTNFRRLFTLS